MSADCQQGGGGLTKVSADCQQGGKKLPILASADIWMTPYKSDKITQRPRMAFEYGLLYCTPPWGKKVPV